MKLTPKEFGDLQARIVRLRDHTVRAEAEAERAEADLKAAEATLVQLGFDPSGDLDKQLDVLRTQIFERLAALEALLP